jgi:hypothetical protein
VWSAGLTLSTNCHKINIRGSVTSLENDIRAWIEHWNTNPKPYVWTRAANQILDSLAGYFQRINDSEH